jgi:hypothetical protein
LPEVIESIKKLGYKLTTKGEILWNHIKVGTLTVPKVRTATGL